MGRKHIACRAGAHAGPRRRATARLAMRPRSRDAASRALAPQAGVTLVEMIAVVAIIGLVAAISFPSVSSGIDSVRLTSASDSVAAFLNAALDRAERRRHPVEVTVSIPENNLTMRSTEPGFVRVLEMPESIAIQRVLPPLPPGSDETIRRFYLYPAGAVPAVGVELANRRGVHRTVRVDPISGVPQVEQVQPGEQP